MAEYIEREALIADIDAAMDFRGMGLVIGQTLKRYVKRQPAADVAPVRHGRWKQHGYWCDGDFRFECSICENSIYPNSYIRECNANYCPNCGARMDGDEK